MSNKKHHHEREEHHNHEHWHGTLGHSHAPKSFGKAFAIGTFLNLAYVVAQVTFGLAAHSLALLADAGHNLGDVLGLVLAWLASYLATRPPTKERTYGWRRASVMAALANAIFLLVAVGGITWEAVRRFSDRGPVAGQTVIWVAALGIVINSATALLFMSGRKGDLNIRGAFLHMAADAAVSAGVVIAGIAILVTGWHLIDPLVSLGINAVIVFGTWQLLSESFNLSMDAVPAGINAVEVKSYLEHLSGVTGVHDLHIWGMSTTEAALTAHIVKPDATLDDCLLAEIKEELEHRFKIGHTTIQFEIGDSAYPCEQEPDEAV